MIKHTIAFGLIALAALALVLTLNACGPFMSPADAYLIEIKQCERLPADEQQACIAAVERKYSGYFSNGEYPPLP